MFNVGPGELFAIVALALIVLGPNRLPDAVRTAGRVVGELRRISGAFQQELRSTLEEGDAESDTTAGSSCTDPAAAPDDLTFRADARAHRVR
jgi:sec-independent protein translocase protein TatB